MSDKLPQWKNGDLISASKMNAMVDAINEIKDGEEVDLSDYATKEFVEEQIANAELGGDKEVDLSDYATKEFVEEQIANAELGGDNTDSGVTIPSYWQSHMDSKIKEINTLLENAGSNADVFIFGTDFHSPNFNNGNTVKLINHIIENTQVRKVILGGDLLQGTGTNAEGVKFFRDLANSFTTKAKIYPVRGNHDNWASVTENQYWSTMCRNLGDYCEVEGKLYYYADEKAHKIRYIFTDSTYSAEGPDYNTTSPEQLEWMSERILELEEGWTVLILHHGVWTVGKGTTIEVNADGQVMLDCIDSIYDTAKCHIAGMWVGHCHRDYNLKAEKGYQVISTTCDANGAQAAYDVANPSRSKGTTTEHAFDVVIFNHVEGKFNTVRIGAGSNREYQYEKPAKTYTPVEGIVIDETIEVMATKNVDLNAQLIPYDASVRDVTWSIESGNDKIVIAPVGLRCKITGIDIGEAVVSVTTAEGSFKDTCNVTVVEPQRDDISNTFISTFTSGAINTLTNEIVQDETWVHSDYVDISAYSTLYMTVANTTTATGRLGYYFYNASKLPISGETHNYGSSEMGYEVKTIEIPSGAKYIRTTWYSSSHPAYNPEWTFSCKAE